MRRKRSEPDATPRLVDMTCGVTEIITARMRGFAGAPDEAFLRLFVTDTVDEDGNHSGAMTIQLDGLDGLKVLCAHLQDFITKLESQGNH